MVSYNEAECIVLFDFETAFIRNLLTDLNEEFESGTLDEWWFPESSMLEYTNILALAHWIKDGLREIDKPTYQLADFMARASSGRSIRRLLVSLSLASLRRLRFALKRFSAATAASTLLVLGGGSSVTFDAWQRASASRRSFRRSATGKGPAQTESKSSSSCADISA